MRKISYIIGVISIVLSIGACKKNTEKSTLKPLPELKTIDSRVTKNGKFAVTLKAQEDLHTAYNIVYVLLSKNTLDDNAETNNPHVYRAKINLKASYTQNGESFAILTDNPSESVSPYNNFISGIMFPFSASADVKYDLSMRIESGGIIDTLEIIPFVQEPLFTKFYSFTSTLDNKDIQFSIIHPIVPIIGKNDISFKLAYRKSNAEVVELNKYDLKVTTFYEGQADPSIPEFTVPYQSDGLYFSSLELTKGGNYEFRVVLSKDGISISDQALSFPFVVK